MKLKAFLAILISFFIGTLIHIYDSNHEPVFVNQIASLIGGGIRFLIEIVILPLIVSLIIMAKKKKFPNDTFTTLTYIILVGVGLIMFLFQRDIKLMAGDHQDGPEYLRRQLKTECIKVAVFVYDFVESSENEEMKKRYRDYCHCLYDKISQEDLIRILEKKIEVPELLNIEYEAQQEECIKDKFQGIATENFSDKMETDEEKMLFWSSKLVSYYLLMYGEFKSEYVTKVLECFTPIFNKHFSNMISDWEKQELTATEIFKIESVIKDRIEECYITKVTKPSR